MTGWPVGELAGWRVRRLAGWPVGGLTGWRVGRLAGWPVSGLAGWRVGQFAGLPVGKSAVFLLASWPVDRPTGRRVDRLAGWPVWGLADWGICGDDRFASWLVGRLVAVPAGVSNRSIFISPETPAREGSGLAVWLFF